MYYMHIYIHTLYKHVYARFCTSYMWPCIWMLLQKNHLETNTDKVMLNDLHVMRVSEIRGGNMSKHVACCVYLVRLKRSLGHQFRVAKSLRSTRPEQNLPEVFCCKTFRRKSLQKLLTTPPCWYQLKTAKHAPIWVQQAAWNLHPRHHQFTFTVREEKGTCCETWVPNTNLFGANRLMYGVHMFMYIICLCKRVTYRRFNGLGINIECHSLQASRW